MYRHFFKRVLDFTITLAGLICISPIFILLCILVRCKLGSPIFFKQIRITKDDKPFLMMKFRTMADSRDANGNLLPDEDRFTMFGNILRNSSLDELPELINVLRGDMSLVGPRPLYTDYLPYYTEEENLRHTVRAGITGLAQINGRNLCKWNDRFAYDVKYVKSMSFVNDILILWKTFFKVANQEDIGLPSVEEELPLNIARRIQQPQKVEVLKRINAKYGKTDTYINEIKEIGGDYFLNESCTSVVSEKCKVFEGNTKQYLSTCRSAIKEILTEIETKIDRKVAFVPSFTCHVCIEPFVEKEYEVFTYALNKDLTINFEQLDREVESKRPSVILIHSFFGLNTLDNTQSKIDILKQKGILLIEDLTHGMWGDFQHLNVPYHIGSIRKWVEIPDGAFVEGLIADCVKYTEDKELVYAKTHAMIEKGKFFRHETDNYNYRRHQTEAEALLDTRTSSFKMSDVSTNILNGLNLSFFKNTRRNNYNRLFDLLKECKQIKIVLSRCDNNEVPYMFPIYVEKDRKELQNYMVSNKIFPTIIWGASEYIKEKIDDNARYIYDNILCVPCDQRYNEEDMERVASVINKFYNN